MYSTLLLLPHDHITRVQSKKPKAQKQVNNDETLFSLMLLYTSNCLI
jgi:hypothetical protein